MTDPRQDERERVAREFVETLLAQDVCLSDAECTIVQRMALILLKSTEADMLEEAANEINDVSWWHMTVPLEAFQNWLRTQAKERRS